MKTVFARLSGLTDITCPFCDARFVTASDAINHVENGVCLRTHNWNRETIHRMIHHLDPTGSVTNKQTESHDERGLGYYATEFAFEGIIGTCYLCQREFDSITAFNEYMNPSVPTGKIYHCLNKDGCDEELISLDTFYSPTRRVSRADTSGSGMLKAPSAARRGYSESTDNPWTPETEC
ncbi:hypothetical protein N7447_007248 [Penicillium robsamsonii]|uniref:uncharacterized protein n=1 Tax=Penicillium robsamsonii TaxID=1792511 RepID=UPI002547FA3C|nr:uncharacterized protein N7447_007248 [Penicillium robsamsonii]KAJ5824908.1 hypothetical protein N7447_007248 [Penicillium robsamsonii]